MKLFDEEGEAVSFDGYRDLGGISKKDFVY